MHCDDESAVRLLFLLLFFDSAVFTIEMFEKRKKQVVLSVQQRLPTVVALALFCLRIEDLFSCHKKNLASHLSALPQPPTRRKRSKAQPRKHSQCSARTFCTPVSAFAWRARCTRRILDLRFASNARGKQAADASERRLARQLRALLTISRVLCARHLAVVARRRARLASCARAGLYFRALQSKVRLSAQLTQASN